MVCRRSGPSFWPRRSSGVFAASSVGPVVALIFMGLGIVVAAMRRFCPSVRTPLAYGAAGLIGIFAMLTAFEGHGLFELPVFTHLGLLFGANLATALAAGCLEPRHDAGAAGWMRIGWRVAASWIGAILMLTLAFELSGARQLSGTTDSQRAAWSIGTAGSGVSGSMELSSIQTLSMQKSCAQLPPLKPKPGMPQSSTCPLAFHSW
jgi:hypothetical protein